MQQPRMPQAVAGRIKCLMERYGVEPAEMAAAQRFSLSTWYNRMKNPQTLTLAEIEIAAKKLRTTPEKLIVGGIEL
jgi:hypothetical protein